MSMHLNTSNLDFEGKYGELNMALKFQKMEANNNGKDQGTGEETGTLKPLQLRRGQITHKLKNLKKLK